MRIIFAGLICLVAGSTLDTARADPYRWCAVLNMGDAAYNCYFLTLEQCRAYVFGLGGSCEPNRFYDGKPIPKG